MGDGSEVKITVNANDNTASAVDAANAKLRTLKAPVLKIQAQLDAAQVTAAANAAGAKAKAKVKFDAEMDAAQLLSAEDKAAAEAKATIKYQSAIDSAELKAKADVAAAEAKATIKFAAAIDNSSLSNSIGKAISDTGYVAMKAAEDVGSEASQGMMSSMSSAMPGQGVLVGSAIAAAVVVGTPIAAGAFAALGATGMIALGAYMQKDNPAIQAGLAALESQFTSTFTDASSSMVTPIDDAMTSIGGMLAGAEPEFKSLFEGAAKDVPILTDGLDRLVQNALPGLTNMIDNSQPIMQGFSDLFANVGTGVSDLANTIANNAPAIGQDIHDVGAAIQFTMGIVSSFVDVTTKLGTGIESFFGMIGKNLGLDKVVGAVSNIGGTAQQTSTQLASVAQVSQSATDDMNSQWGRAASDFTGNTTDMQNDLKALSSTTTDTKTAVQSFADYLEGIGQSGAEQVNSFTAAATTDLSTFADSFKNLSGAALNTDGTIDQFTQSGANLQTKMQGAQADIGSVAEAMYRAGDSTDQVNATVGKLVGTLETQLETSLGISKTKADALIQSFGLMPNQIDTSIVVTANTNPAQLAIENTIRWADSQLITLGVSTAGAGSGTNARKAIGGAIGAAAVGGPRSMLTLVGEQGPELINAPIGARVTPASNVASELRGAGSGGGTAKHTIDFSGDTDGALAQALMKLMRQGKITIKSQWVN